MFAFLYFTWVGQGIGQKNLYARGARIDQSTHGPVLKKPRKAGRNARIIPTNFISHQQACGWSTLAGSLQAVLGLKQDGAGMRGEHANDNGFEFLKLVPWNRTLCNLQFGGEKAAQRVALINRKSANDAARIRDTFEPFSLTGRQPHSNPPLQGAITNRMCGIHTHILYRLFHHLDDAKVPRICTASIVPDKKGANPGAAPLSAVNYLHSRVRT